MARPLRDEAVGVVNYVMERDDRGETAFEDDKGSGHPV